MECRSKSTAGAAVGDRFLIKPTADAVSGLQVMITDPSRDRGGRTDRGVEVSDEYRQRHDFAR